MEDFQHRKKMRKAVSSRTFFFVVFFFTIALLNGAWGMWSKERESYQEREKVANELEVIRVREQELQSSIDRLKTPGGVEKEIRQKFSVAKEGEQVVLIVDEKKLTSQAEGVRDSLWNRVGKWFANLFRSD